MTDAGSVVILWGNISSRVNKSTTLPGATVDSCFACLVYKDKYTPCLFAHHLLGKAGSTHGDLTGDWETSMYRCFTWLPPSPLLYTNLINLQRLSTSHSAIPSFLFSGEFHTSTLTCHLFLISSNKLLYAKINLFVMACEYWSRNNPVPTLQQQTVPHHSGF